MRDQLDYFELPENRIRAFSKGTKQRLVLAQALLGKPPFLILDEPLNGLDPHFIIKLRQALMNYLRDGGTLLFSSHILAEAEKIASDFAILHQGKLVLAKAATTVVQEYGSLEQAFAKVAG